MDPTYPLFPITSFICFVLVLAPLQLHLRLRNAGTSMYIIWTATSCLILFVNSLVWRNNAIDKAPVWCDISGRILLGYGIAVPACGLCIQRRLYLATQIVINNQKEKTKYIVQDLFISLGLPLLVMALAYIVQGHRYDIYEDIGCTATPIYNVWPAYPLYTVWPLVIGVVSMCYSLLTLRSFVSRRSEFNEFINSETVTFKRHVRLMCLASTDIAFTIPLSVWGIQTNIQGIQPYVSWEDTHFAFSVIRTHPGIIWRSNESSRFHVEYERWIVVFCAVVFIAFFTFTEESRRKYSLTLDAMLTRFGWSHLNKIKSPARKRGHDTLPPMFPADRTMDGTFVSSITTDTVGEMAERERVGHFCYPVSTMVFSNAKAGPNIASTQR